MNTNQTYTNVQNPHQLAFSIIQELINYVLETEMSIIITINKELDILALYDIETDRITYRIDINDEEILCNKATNREARQVLENYFKQLNQT